MLLNPTLQTFIPHPGHPYTFITLLSFHHSFSNRLDPYLYPSNRLYTRSGPQYTYAMNAYAQSETRISPLLRRGQSKTRYFVWLLALRGFGKFWIRREESGRLIVFFFGCEVGYLHMHSILSYTSSICRDSEQCLDESTLYGVNLYSFSLLSRNNHQQLIAPVLTELLHF